MLSGAWHKDEGVNFGRKGTVSVCCWLTLLCPAQGLAWSPTSEDLRWLKFKLPGGDGAEKGEGVALSALLTFLGRISRDGGLIK